MAEFWFQCVDCQREVPANHDYCPWCSSSHPRRVVGPRPVVPEPTQGAMSSYGGWSTDASNAVPVTYHDGGGS